MESFKDILNANANAKIEMENIVNNYYGNLPKPPLRPAKKHFSDLQYEQIENANIFWEPESIEYKNWVTKIFDQKEARLVQITQFLDRHNIVLDIDKNNFDGFTLFTLDNINYHPDPLLEYERSNDLWVSIIVDFFIFVWNERIKKDSSLTWGPMQHIGDNRVFDLLVIDAGSDSKNSIWPLYGARTWLRKMNGPQKNVWSIQSPAFFTVPERNLNILNTFFGDVYQNFPRRLRKEKFVDKDYVMSEKLLPLVKPALIFLKNSDDWFERYHLQPNADLEVINLAKSILKKQDSFIQERIEEFSKFMQRHLININVVDDNYEQLDEFIRFNIDPTNDPLLENFQPSDFWLSILIDSILFIVNEKQKEYPQLTWKIGRAKNNLDVLMLKEEYSADNLARMKRGSAPQQDNSDAPNGIESMELSHEPVPQRDGGKEFVQRWPQEHAIVDPYRNPGY